MRERVVADILNELLEREIGPYKEELERIHELEKNGQSPTRESEAAKSGDDLILPVHSELIEEVHQNYLDFVDGEMRSTLEALTDDELNFIHTYLLHGGEKLLLEIFDSPSLNPGFNFDARYTERIMKLNNIETREHLLRCQVANKRVSEDYQPAFRIHEFLTSVGYEE